MTNSDFDSQFDILYNNISSNQAPGLNSYEKSIFLTKAQDDIILSLYNGNSGKSFEETEELRRYLANIVLDAELTPLNSDATGLPKSLSSSSSFFKLPQEENKKVWFIIYENAHTSDYKCGKEKEKTLDVVPKRYDEYARLKNNPFRGINDNRVLRFDFSSDIVELVSKFTLDKYYIRYLREPKPIILEDLYDNLTIKGKSTSSSCELHDGLHQTILERAVTLAIQSWNNK